MFEMGTRQGSAERNGSKHSPWTVRGSLKQGLFLFYECGESMGWYGRW